MICIWRGIYLYAVTFSMTLRFLILSSFLFTQNLRIDKNYTLSIFMLSGSIQFYSIFQFNMTCIYYKTMPFLYQTILMLIHFHMLSLYKSLIISNYAFSHAFNLLKSNHEIQTYTFKDVFSLQISFFTDQSLLSHFVYTIHIHDEFRLMNPVLFVIR